MAEKRFVFKPLKPKQKKVDDDGDNIGSNFDLGFDSDDETATKKQVLPSFHR